MTDTNPKVLKSSSEMFIILKNYSKLTKVHATSLVAFKIWKSSTDYCFFSTPGITTILTFVGRNAIAAQIPWIKLAAQVPTIKRFFPSEYGTDIEYSPESANEVPHQQKLKVRAALKEQTALEYTYVVTGPYVEGFISTTPAAPEAGSFDVKKKKAFLVGDGKGEVSVITMTEYVPIQSQP